MKVVVVLVSSSIFPEWNTDSLAIYIDSKDIPHHQKRKIIHLSSMRHFFLLVEKEGRRGNGRDAESHKLILFCSREEH